MYIVSPIDPTTKFLQDISNKLLERFGEYIRVITVEPSIDSYEESLSQINEIPKGSTVLFMGHGQDNCIYGGENPGFFEKRALLKGREIEIFDGQNIFLLACNSNEYLRTTFKYSKVVASVGFGSLPTEMDEVNNNRRLLEQGIHQGVIDAFKLAINTLVIDTFTYVITNNHPFAKLPDYFMLYLNKMMSSVIMANKEDEDNRRLADLLFKMKNEMVFI